MMKPIQKGTRGAFTCLGNWYHLKDQESLEEMVKILVAVGKRDRRTGLDELIEAIEKYMERENADS